MAAKKRRAKNGIVWKNFPEQTMAYVVYLFRCPETGEPRYVGVTDNLKRRVTNHFWRTGQRLAVSRWIADVRKKGLFPRVEILGQYGNDGAAGLAEQSFIELYMDSGILNTSRRIYTGNASFQKEDVEFPNGLRVVQIVGRPFSLKLEDRLDDSMASRTIKKEMRCRGISLVTAAKLLDLTYQAFGQWLVNKCKPPIDAALRLCELFCFLPEEWIQPCQSTPASASTTPAPSPDPSARSRPATSRHSESFASLMSV